MRKRKEKLELSPALQEESNLCKTTRKKHIKFDYKFLEMAGRLVASGMSQKDLAFFMGVHEVTICNWKKKYPRFAEALESGTKVACSHVMASGLRSATGYDYEEVSTKYERRVDEKTGEVSEVLVERKVTTKHKCPDAGLVQFFLINLMPDTFRRKMEIESRTVSMKVTPDDVKQGIAELAGKLMDDTIDVTAEVKDAE